MKPNADDRNEMVTSSELARVIGIGRVTLWRWEVDGLIPAATRINQTRSGYLPDAVLAIEAFALAYKDVVAKKRAEVDESLHLEMAELERKLVKGRRNEPPGIRTSTRGQIVGSY